jgi:hypothetical protein
MSTKGDLTGHLIYQSTHMLVSRDSNPRYPGSNGETLPSSLKSLHCLNILEHPGIPKTRKFHKYKQ